MNDRREDGLISGRLVRLRECTLADADLLDRWNREMDVGGFNDFGPREPVDREVLARGPLRTARSGTLMIEAIETGERVGTVGFRLVTVYGPSPNSDAYQIGIELAPEARGRGYGGEAQRLLADYLFASTAINRVEASTDAENMPEQRALEKAGYTREGTMRGSQFRGGRYHDLVYYSRLRTDPG